MKALRPATQNIEHNNMDSTFTTSDKELMLQFLNVLHGWLQDTKRDKQNELEVIQLQEGIVKLLYARISGGDTMTPEEIIRSADTIFEPDEEEAPVEAPPTHEEDGNVIDIASWIRNESQSRDEKDEE